MLCYVTQVALDNINEYCMCECVVVVLMVLVACVVMVVMVCSMVVVGLV